MADHKYERPERLRPYSRRFEQFIDDELDGDVSDLNISDDEDADPDFEPGEPILLAQQHSSSDENDDEEGNLLAPRRVSTDSYDAPSLLSHTDDPIFSGLNIGGKAVIKLLSTFPKGVSVYMDRYFTSVDLLDLLHSEREASGTGTLQKQRVPTDSKLKEDRDMRREGRGSIDQSVRCDGQISVVKWFGNKAVLLISSKEGVEPVDKCRRWCKTRRVFLDVDRPLVVKKYNTYMGGVDFLDRVISYYRISARTRKWPIRGLMHFFDFSIAAGWIEYRRDQRALGTPKKDILDLKGFKEEYAEFLVYGSVQESTEDSDDPDYRCSLPAARKRPRVTHPSDQLRTRNVLHMPEISGPTKKNRCRFPGCSSNGARVRCTSCQVYLCLQENRNCFKAYHEL